MRLVKYMCDGEQPALMPWSQLCQNFRDTKFYGHYQVRELEVEMQHHDWVKGITDSGNWVAVTILPEDVEAWKKFDAQGDVREPNV